jgi:hypothetical protein
MVDVAFGSTVVDRSGIVVWSGSGTTGTGATATVVCGVVGGIVVSSGVVTGTVVAGGVTGTVVGTVGMGGTVVGSSVTGGLVVVVSTTVKTGGTSCAGAEDQPPIDRPITTTAMTAAGTYRDAVRPRVDRVTGEGDDACDGGTGKRCVIRTTSRENGKRCSVLGIAVSEREQSRIFLSERFGKSSATCADGCGSVKLCRLLPHAGEERSNDE